MRIRFRASFRTLFVFWSVAVVDARAVIGMTPLRVDVYARPGIATPFELTLINTTPSPRTVRLIVQRVEVDEDGNVAMIEENAETGPTNALSGDSERPRGPDVRALVTIDEGNEIALGPAEKRVIHCSVNLPPDARDEYLAMVLADPGPEEMPVYGNTSRRINVVFRIGVQVFIVSGIRQVIGSGDNEEVLVRRLKPEFYNVDVSELEFVLPKAGDNPSVLSVAGKIVNASTTFISPVVRASLRDVANRRIVEETVLKHGFDMVLANTSRRFRGSFDAPLQPGKYQLTVEVDWGDERQRTRKDISIELTTAIAGNRPPSKGVIELSMSKALISLRPGETSRGRITIKNTYDEPIRVTPTFSDESLFNDWFKFSPARVVIPAKSERTIQVAVRADRESPQLTQKVVIGMVPVTFSGTSFPLSETKDIEATVRVLPPKSVSSDGTSASTAADEKSGSP
jgi:hypothetical protein